MKSDARIYAGENHVPSAASVAIHNGNTGMTAAAARNGVPQVVLPRLMTQADWSRRIEQLQIGISTSEDPDSAVQAAKKVCETPHFKDCSAAISKKITGRTSLAAAVEIIAKQTI